VEVVSATVTIITGHIEDPRLFRSMDFHERRRTSVGWKELPSRSGHYPSILLFRATQVDLGVIECEPKVDWETDEKVHSYLIDGRTLAERLPLLAAMVDSNAAATARALVAKVGDTADLAGVLDALKAGTWPDGNDAAAEAGAFAHHLLEYARLAVQFEMGVFWEYRGHFPWGDQEIVEGQSAVVETPVTRALLEAVIARPDDLDARLVYADALLEAGDLRGEFIRLDCEMSGLPHFDPRRRVCARRRGALLLANANEWLLPVVVAAGGSRLRFRNGFLEEVTLQAGADLGALRDAAPLVRSLTLHHAEWLPTVLADPSIGRLHTLALPLIELGELQPHVEGLPRGLTGLELGNGSTHKLPHAGPERHARQILDVVERMPSLTRLTLSVRFFNADFDQRGLSLVLDGLAALPALRELTLVDCDAFVLETVAATPLPKLAMLTVFGSVGARGLGDLLAAPRHPSLRSLRIRADVEGTLESVTLAPSLRELWLALEEPTALVAADLSGLEILRLRWSPIADTDARLLVRSPLPRLRELDLRSSMLTDEGARALAGIDAPSLVYLDVTEGRFGEEGLAALLPLARRLRLLLAGSFNQTTPLPVPPDLSGVLFTRRSAKGDLPPGYFPDLEDPDLTFVWDEGESRRWPALRAQRPSGTGLEVPPDEGEP
jgi:uncharacterized protein (TIGR02996 family)